MIFIYIILSILISGLIWVGIKNIIVFPIIKKYKNIIKDFHNNFHENSLIYCDYYLWEKWHSGYTNTYKKRDFKKLKSFLTRSKQEIIDEFNNLINRKISDNYNNHFVDKKITKHLDFLNHIESYPFDNNQLKAIIHDEINNLVIAGAGSGKTSTIVGKVVYLIKIKQVEPAKILLLSFTKKAVEEMEERIDKILKMKLNIKTFHSLGYEMISESADLKKEIAFSNDNNLSLYEFIEKILKNLMLEDPDFERAAGKYFKLYFDNLKPININSELTTKRKEKVKSYQELVIANFLYENNIKYVYEESYKFNTASKKFRQYHPDFYLPDFDIYIEHFALNKNLEPPDIWTKRAKESYIEGIKWKRDLHLTNNTKILETYSWEFEDGIFTSLFSQKLSKFGIPINDDYSRNSVFSNPISEKKYFMVITDLMTRFITLFKSNNYTIEKILNNKNRIDAEKALCYITMFSKVYEKYQRYLREKNQIDFSDMIRESTSLLERRIVEYNFDYIIIDEFQDISLGRYDLLLALKNQNPNLKFFCVGDDWQSIYRFTGSDINLFYSFEKYFGVTKRLEITKTYRFNKELALLSEKFITKNKLQTRKTILSDKSIKSKPFKVYYYDNNIQETFEKIIESINTYSYKKIDIMILGRYKFTFTNYSSIIQTIKKKYSHLINIECLTVHLSKGKEADYVIILDVIEDLYGFPSQIQDDDVLNLVLLSNENYPYAEERRLFYVAMTRAKNKFFILNEKNKISPFVKEIIEIYNSNSKDECPVCNGLIVKKAGKYGSFSGCSNYPVCRYTCN